MAAVAEPPVARLAALPGVSTASRVAAQAERARATGRVLPVAPALAGLLPDGGLRRGSTVAVHGGTSLLLALLAQATAAGTGAGSAAGAGAGAGSWAAVVGMPSLGLAAAAEYGVDLARVALVPRPGAELPAVVAALLDGVDLVAVHSETVSATVARRLSARARHRGAVLLAFGAWPGADVELSCRRESWSGIGSCPEGGCSEDGPPQGDCSQDRCSLGACQQGGCQQGGYGHLRERRALVRARGRGAAARPVSAELCLPGAGGEVTLAVPSVQLRVEATA
ncbi:hypothetical protein [Amycolatopsis sp. NPDC021455]|uniref:hypothetical protein n=1 Tax=Amycolatopsis sp. NPDC021455 TaxID=3154901 RepID=UPI0033C153DA